MTHFKGRDGSSPDMSIKSHNMAQHGIKGQQQASSWVVPQITSTSDPEWKALLGAIVQPSSSFSEEGIDRLFSSFKKVSSSRCIPDYIVVGDFSAPSPPALFFPLLGVRPRPPSARIRLCLLGTSIARARPTKMLEQQSKSYRGLRGLADGKESDWAWFTLDFSMLQLC